MNFNLDDPLADLLSDNSNDNDSFFDNQSGRKTINRPPPSTRTSGGKGKMEDLFGIKEESEPQFKVPPIRTPLGGNKKEDKPLVTSTPKKITETDENLDILSDLGFDPKKPKSNITSKANLFDDILGTMDSRKPSTAPSSKIEDLSTKRDDGMSTRGTISRQSTDTTENSAILGQARPKTSTGRRSSMASPAKNNPLEFFSSQKENESLRVPTSKGRKKGSTADWLGLGTESDEEPVKVDSVRVPETIPKVEILKIEQVEEAIQVPTNNPIHSEQVSSFPVAMASPIPFLLTTSNISAKNASQVIEQQEAQIVLASQLKNQESALLEMQRRQHDLLSRQEVQFNDLLQKQLSRQNQLEQSIKAQQDRINAHIQLLMSQPQINNFHSTESKLNEDEKPQETQVKLIELQADVKRLELEKMRLEDLVSTVNENYEKEIEMIEKSFKKQIEVLDNHLTSVEDRLKAEIESLHKFYTEKLNTANQDKIETKKQSEASLIALRHTHEEEIQRLKTSHEEDIDGMKEDHRRMIETIRQSKLLEFATVQESGSYLETLRMASTNLESVSGDLQTLRSEIERKMDILHRERELRLDAREKKLEDSERRLKILEETNENEKSRLMDLVSSLESQLTKLSKDSSEENWIQRQKMSSLEAEKLVFEKEKVLAREQIARDEKRVEDLKEQQLSETQRQMEQIQHERHQLNIEKAKFETSKRLESHTDTERLRQEVEASLKIAQDGAHQAELERERFLKLQRQLEIQKRSLFDKENNVRFKEEELEQEILHNRTTEKRTNEAAQKARAAEQNFNEKIMFLQQKMREISEKETQLSQERLSLSQERIELQNYKAKLDESRCSLCRIGERSGELSQVLRSSDGIPVIDDQQYTMLRSNDVDRFLDENIALSLDRMKDTTHRQWIEFERTIGSVRPTSCGERNFDISKYGPANDFLGN